MKKSIILFGFILLVFTVSMANAQEDADIYEYLYNVLDDDNHSAQLAILQNMAEARLSGAGEFYATALRKLVAGYRNIKNVTERNAADDQAVLLSALLATEKYTRAAPDLWLVVDQFTAPLVRAEALMALGRIRATNYLPQVIRVLESVNASPAADRLSGERVAFGAIISLEKYGDPSGYLPVFFASQGWYSERIKSQALKSLPFIAENPAPYMLEVVKGPGYDYPTKYAALRTIEDGRGVPNNAKAEVAAAAFAEGWKGVTNDVQLRTTLANMRKLSIEMINKYKSDDEAIYPLLERSYSQGYDMQEKLYAIAALASQGTDEGARRLASFLMDLNAKRLAGNIRQEEEQLVRAVIPALGQAGRSVGRSALTAVGSSNWTPAVRSLADDAIKKLN